MKIRLRQICLVAEKLAPVTDDLKSVLGLEVCFVDPAVGKYGLENVLLPIGNNFLEVVAPTRDGTAAGRYLGRRQGDGGYMVITQAADHDFYRKRVADLGIRVVADLKYDDFTGMQLHPRDVGGAILSIDATTDDCRDPAGSWHPAGPDWKPARRTEVVSDIRAAELQSPDPTALARRWSEILDIPVERDAHAVPTINLDNAVLRFVEAADGRGEGLGGLDLAATDAARAFAEAERRGLRTGEEEITICGTRFRLI